MKGRFMLNDFFDSLDPEEEYSNFDLFEITSVDDISGLIDFLGEKIFESYKDVDFIKRHFAGSTKEDLREYLQTHVYPEDEIQIDQNVKNGDLGEILGEQTIYEFEDNLKVPIKKLKWKFNNKKSVFCTDIFAHNDNGPIDVLKYYEVKTYTTRNLDVGVKAFDGLLSDYNSGKEPIANFLSQMNHAYAVQAKEFGNNQRAEELYSLSDEYMDIVKGRKNFTRKYEAILIREKRHFRNEELDRIESKTPFTDNFMVSVVLVDNLQEIINQSFERSYDIAWELINEDE